MSTKDVNFSLNGVHNTLLTNPFKAYFLNLRHGKFSYIFNFLLQKLNISSEWFYKNFALLY